MHLQFGHEGDDLHSMTRRWQLTQTAAAMLPHEPCCFFASSGVADLEFGVSSELEKVEMLSSKSRFCSLGLLQLLFRVFLSRKTDPTIALFDPSSSGLAPCSASLLPLSQIDSENTVGTRARSEVDKEEVENVEGMSRNGELPTAFVRLYHAGSGH
ncbi:hypothetical protein BHE74_00009536 [Ensete ventricosum]|nr:hypothetical protein GW17_00006568 [Ensete ventricosum]RWW82029.1 hypothetical protein BHE74_00009536 [Ensete ventricosum]RZR94779.1 hypothetical protein BHM03_00023544 [Ensete ventricosum]